MKLKFISIVLVTFFIVCIVCSYFYKSRNYKHNVPNQSVSSEIIVNPEFVPSFVSLRFQHVSPASIEGIAGITPEKFEECLKYLSDNNFHFLSAKEVYDFMVNKVPIPEKSIWLTFDEGMESAYTYVTPLMQKYDARAAEFVGIVWLRKPYRLTNNHLSAMSKSGVWDIQTHGYTGNLSYPINSIGEEGNFYLYRLWQIDRPETIKEYQNRIKKDLNDAFEYLKSNFNSEKFFFAYPFGESVSSLDFENSMSKYLLECLDELKIIGVDKRNINSISNDWSTKKHLISRYDVNEYTYLETILSPRYTGKKVLYTDETGISFSFNNLSQYDKNTFLCWDEKCNFIFADNNLKPISGVTNTMPSSGTTSNILAAAFNEDIVLVDTANSNLVFTDKNLSVISNYSLDFNPAAIWNNNNRLYLLDKSGKIYEFTGAPNIVFSSNITGDSIKACASGDILFIVDDDKKEIRTIDYIQKKLLQTYSYDKNYCIVPQYGLSNSEFIAWEAKNEVFVKVKIK